MGGGKKVDKIAFLTAVSEVMKGMISYDGMMESIQRSCMRGEEENLKMIKLGEKQVDEFITGLSSIQELTVPPDIMDILVLRYLKNTQFLAKREERAIDVSGIDGGSLGYWKKTMLFRNADTRGVKE